MVGTMGDLNRSAADRAMTARIAAHTRWGRTVDRSKATAPARSAWEAGFEREADPDGVLTPAERAKRVKNLKSAHFTRLARLSAEARRRRRGH